jgi:hypothetical protein
MARIPQTDVWDEVRDDGGPPGFDVTCVIGRVEVGPNGEHSPYEAAWLLIARHDTEGTFKFELGGMEHAITLERRNLGDAP